MLGTTTPSIRLFSSSIIRLVGGSSSTANSLKKHNLNNSIKYCCRGGQYNLISTIPLQKQQTSTGIDVSEESHFCLILGKPGGGKGTISGKILKDFPKFYHVSTGDILRQQVRDGTELGTKAKEYMDGGKLVPDELIIDLVLQDAEPYIKEKKSLLLDGFPRNLQQAIALEDFIHVNMVINLDIPTETIVERIADRWIHPASGRIYSYSYKPPKVKGKDDETGEPLVQRPDDMPENVRIRLKAYDENTAPLVSFYEENGVLKTFKGTQSDVIYPEVKLWLESQLSK